MKNSRVHVGWGGVKKQMGRKVLRPNSDKVAEWLYENMPPEIKGKILQM